MQNAVSIPPALTAAFGPRLLLDEPLAKHTSARIGGPADAFLIARSLHDLKQAARIAWEHDLPLFILGGGSNILISDRGVRGLVVHNQADAVTFEGPSFYAESGAGTIQIARKCAKQGLTGFEWAIGIPGNIGGAVYGNAGAHSGDIHKTLDYADLITPDGPSRLSNAELAFEYRSSILKREHRRCVILGARFTLAPADPAAIKQHMADFTAYRKRTQPPGATIGSMFKNPPGDYAGRLIEAAGLKGHQIGGAQISTIHANFFLNAGDATAADVIALADLARSKVKDQSGIDLHLEIERVGEWPAA
jgi:UDP-N-acetylmuramate dehydrogenase